MEMRKLRLSMEEGMATHSSIAWRPPWKEETDGLQTTQSPRSRHDWAAEQRKDMTWGPRFPPLSIFGSQKNQRNVKWVPYQFTPRSGGSWRDSLLQGDKRMEVGCDQALPYRGSGKTTPKVLLLRPWKLPLSPLPFEPWWLNLFLDSGS